MLPVQSEGSLAWGASYHARLEQVYSTLVAPGQRVLEMGCARGDLLASVKPSYGLGIDLSSEMVARARRDHPTLEFRQGDVHDLRELRDPFDTIILSDLINDLWDVQTVFQEVRRLSTARTRVILNFYSRLWELPLGAASALKLTRPSLSQNWLTLADTTNLLFLADLEVVRAWEEVLGPLRTPLVGGFANRYLAKLWPFKHLALADLVLARPQADHSRSRSRVLAGWDRRAGGADRDRRRSRAQRSGQHRQRLRAHAGDGRRHRADFRRGQFDRRHLRDDPARDRRASGMGHAASSSRPAKGKGDAVRLGFAHAKGDILMILDADLTMPPEDLPRFYEALASRQGGIRQRRAAGLSAWKKRPCASST